MNHVPSIFFAAGEDQQKAAPLGLFVLVLLGVACYFLFRSMTRHLKRVREDFPAGSPTRPGGGGPHPGPAAPSATNGSGVAGTDESGDARPR